MNRLTLKDALETNFADLLKTIQTDYGTDDESNPLLWSDLDETALANLSADYYFRSRHKILTTMSRMAYDPDDASRYLSAMGMEVCLRFGDQFRRVYDTYFKGTYNPLHNYDMEEKRTPDLSFETDADQDFKSTTTSKGDEYGFNSTDPVPVSESEATTEGTKDYNKNHSKTTHKGSETLTRKGNIGVMSTVDLIEQELRLRKFDYWRWVFETIDLVLVRNYFAY